MAHGPGNAQVWFSVMSDNARSLSIVFIQVGLGLPLFLCTGRKESCRASLAIMNE